MPHSYKQSLHSSLFYSILISFHRLSLFTYYPNINMLIEERSVFVPSPSVLYDKRSLRWYFNEVLKPIVWESTSPISELLGPKALSSPSAKACSVPRARTALNPPGRWIRILLWFRKKFCFICWYPPYGATQDSGMVTLSKLVSQGSLTDGHYSWGPCMRNPSSAPRDKRSCCFPLPDVRQPSSSPINWSLWEGGDG